MDKSLDRYQVRKLNQDKINDLNSPISPKEIEEVINSLPNKQTKAQDKMGLLQSSIRSSKKTKFQLSSNYSTK
jgi:ADP-dependent phosphofructokinase/glucokinase